MKTFKNVDAIQLATLAGSVLTLAGTLLSGYASGKKLDATIDEKVAEAIAKHLANSTSNE